MTDLLQGNPIKKILVFCGPLLIGNLFQQLYSVADSIIVGQLIGQEAFGGVGATGALSFLVLGLVIGLCSGFGIPLSQDFGAEDIQNMRKGIGACIWLCSGITLVMTVLMYFFTDDMLRLMDTPVELFDYAYDYIFAIFMGMGACVLYNMLACILRAVGNSKSPLYFLIIACVLNIVLDFVFIALFKMGVAGAGYATILAQLISGILCLITITKKFPELCISKKDMRFNKAYSLRMFKMGIPMGLQFSITALGVLVIQVAINGLGYIAVTAMSVGSRVSGLMTAPMESLGIAVATFSGQNLGAKKIMRIKQGMRQCMVAGLIYCSIAVSINCIFGNQLVDIFVKNATDEIKELATTFLTINSFFYPVLIMVFVYRNSLQGMGYSAQAMMAGVLEMVARSLVAFVLVGSFGYVAACFANAASWVLASVFLVTLYKKKIALLLKFGELGIHMNR